MTEPKHICHECGEPILEDQIALTLKEATTGHLVYVAHRECAVNSEEFRKLAIE